MEPTAHSDGLLADPAGAAAEPSALEVILLTAEFVGWGWSLPQQQHLDLPGGHLSFGEQLAEIA